MYYPRDNCLRCFSYHVYAVTSLGKERQRLGARLRERRVSDGLPQAQLGARASLSGKFVGEIERGGNVSVAALFAIAAALRVPTSSLFDRSAPIAHSGKLLTVAELDRV